MHAPSSHSRLERIVAIAVLALAILPAASNGQDTVRVTLDESIRIALDRNPSVLRATSLERAADARARLADAAFQPDLRLTGGPSVRHTPGATGASEARGSDDPLSTTLAIGASSTYLLLDGSARDIELARARLDLDASRLARRRIAQDVVYRVTSTAIDAAVARELIGVEQENLVAERRLLEQVEAFVDAGARPVAERFVQDAAVAAAELRVLTAQRNLAATTVALALVLGQDPTRPVVVSTLGPTTITALDSAVRVDIARAYGARFDIGAQRTRIEAAKQDVLAAEAGSSLSLGLTGAIGTNYTSSTTGAFGEQLGRNNPTASLGLSLTLPLLDRDRTSITAGLARLEIERLQQDLAQLEREVSAEIELARLDYSTAIARSTVADRQLEAARQALAAEEARFAGGTSTLAELALTRARYTSAASQRVQAGYELVERRALLQYVVGETPTPGL